MHPLEQATTYLGLEKIPAGPRPNKQLYAGSELSQSPTTQAQDSSPDALFGDKDPNLQIKHERPWHRVVIYLAAQGETNRNIAKRFGCSEAWISQLTRQPWFKARFLQELKESGQDILQATLKTHALPALEKVIEVMNNEKSKPSEQLTAAKDILDRFLGKAVTKIESKGTLDITQASEKVSAVDAELEQLERQLQESNGHRRN